MSSVQDRSLGFSKRFKLTDPNESVGRHNDDFDKVADEFIKKNNLAHVDKINVYQLQLIREEWNISKGDAQKQRAALWKIYVMNDAKCRSIAVNAMIEAEDGHDDLFEVHHMRNLLEICDDNVALVKEDLDERMTMDKSMLKRLRLIKNSAEIALKLVELYTENN